MLTSKTITATKLDGSTVEIIVRALPLSQMEAYLTIEPDANAVVKLCCPDTNPDEFTAGSTLDLADAAEELNSPFGERLLDRASRLKARYERTEIPSPKSSPTSSAPVAPPIGTAPKA